MLPYLLHILTLAWSSNLPESHTPTELLVRKYQDDTFTYLWVPEADSSALISLDEMVAQGYEVVIRFSSIEKKNFYEMGSLEVLHLKMVRAMKLSEVHNSINTEISLGKTAFPKEEIHAIHFSQLGEHAIISHYVGSQATLDDESVNLIDQLLIPKPPAILHLITEEVKGSHWDLYTSAKDGVGPVWDQVGLLR